MHSYIGALHRWYLNSTAFIREFLCPYHSQPITTGGVNYRDQPWHKECFVCIGCKQQLAGQRFTSRDDFAYCFDCFCNLFAKKCAYCTTPISGKASPELAYRVGVIL